MKRGVCNYWSERGFGFIGGAMRGENDAFVHSSNLVGATRLAVGDTVEYEVKDSERGPRAVLVRVVQAE